MTAYATTRDLYRYGLARGALAMPGRLVESSAAASDLLTLDGHGFVDGDAVLVRAAEGGTLSAPLAEGTTYYVLRQTDSTFKLAATDGGAAIDLTSTSLGAGATFATVSSTNSAGKGVNLDTVTGTFTANGGSISNAATGCLDVNGGSGNITGSPRWLVTRVWMSMNSSAPFFLSWMSCTRECAVTVSPATMGAKYSKPCSACSTLACGTCMVSRRPNMAPESSSTANRKVGGTGRSA